MSVQHTRRGRGVGVTRALILQLLLMLLLMVVKLLLGRSQVLQGMWIGAWGHGAHQGRVDWSSRPGHGHVSAAKLMGHAGAGCTLLCRVGRHAGAHGMASDGLVGHASRVPSEVGTHACGHYSLNPRSAIHNVDIDKRWRTLPHAPVQWVRVLASSRVCKVSESAPVSRRDGGVKVSRLAKADDGRRSGSYRWARRGGTWQKKEVCKARLERQRSEVWKLEVVAVLVDDGGDAERRSGRESREAAEAAAAMEVGAALGTKRQTVTAFRRSVGRRRYYGPTARHQVSKGQQQRPREAAKASRACRRERESTSGRNFDGGLFDKTLDAGGNGGIQAGKTTHQAERAVAPVVLRSAAQTQPRRQRRCKAQASKRPSCCRRQGLPLGFWGGDGADGMNLGGGGGGPRAPGGRSAAERRLMRRPGWRRRRWDLPAAYVVGRCGAVRCVGSTKRARERPQAGEGRAPVCCQRGGEYVIIHSCSDGGSHLFCEA